MFLDLKGPKKKQTHKQSPEKKQLDKWFDGVS